MRLKVMISGLAMAVLAGCDAPPVAVPAPTSPGQSSVASSEPVAQRADVAARRFVQVVRTVEPVAESECRARAQGLNCDFLIVVDDRPDQPVNAYQSLDKSGRPVIAFTLGLIAEVRNDDELAFIMSHEAAHHIRNHIARQRASAGVAATVFGGLASVGGAGSAGVELATRLGAAVGSRTYSKDYELEADALGAQIAQRAGYDAMNGALYFSRIPDPGDRFLGTHPPNNQRLEVVRRTLGAT